MTLWSRRFSPVRLLLCAAFMGLAFVLASWTSASADDRGLLSAVEKAVPSVDKVVEDATDTVVSTSSAVPVVELDAVVAPPVRKIAKVVEKPAVVVDEVTDDVVQKTTKALSDSAVRVTDTVKDIAPVSAAVVDPVVEVVRPPSSDAEPAPLPDLPDLPDLGDRVVETLDPESVGASSSAPPVAAGTSPSRVSSPPHPATGSASVTAAALVEKRSPEAVQNLVAVARAAAVARAVDSPGEGLPIGQPTGPLAVVGGLTPAPSGGSSSSGSPDAGLTPSWFSLPRFLPPAVASEQSCHAPGPCPDPGSRPG